MRAIEVTGEDLEEILKHMPDHLKKKIASLIRPDSGIRFIKDFIEQYEDDHMVDHMTAHVISNLIRKIWGGCNSVNESFKKAGEPGISTFDVGLIIIESLKAESENIKNALDEHEKECEGKDCGAQHKTKLKH